MLSTLLLPAIELNFISWRKCAEKFPLWRRIRVLSVDWFAKGRHKTSSRRWLQVHPSVSLVLTDLLQMQCWFLGDMSRTISTKIKSLEGICSELLPIYLSKQLGSTTFKIRCHRYCTLPPKSLQEWGRKDLLCNLSLGVCVSQEERT